MYLAFQGLRGLVFTLPLRSARSLGRAIGHLAFVVLRSQRTLTLDNLRYAFGDGVVTPRQLRRIARGVFVNLGENVMEWLKLPRLSVSDLKRLIVCEGSENLRQVLTKGQGAIVVSGHFGNWELMPMYVKSLGFEGGVLARRLRYPEYESFLMTMRNQKGIPTITRGSLKDVAKLLRNNQVVGMMPDQDIDSLDGVFVEFFGHPTYTPVGPAALSLMTGAAILPCFIIRDGGRFRFVIEPPLSAPKTSDRAAALKELTQAWSSVLESYIRRHPDHWVWMHRRWKTKPSDRAEGVSADKASRVSALNPVTALILAAACAVTWTLGAGCGKSESAKKLDEMPAGIAGQGDSDQQMSGFTLTGYEADGRKKWILKGDEASVDRNIVTVHHPDGIGYDLERTSYLTATLAQVNQDNHYVRLEHDVTIHTSDGLWFATPLLYWIPDKGEAVTDEAVRIETNHMLLRGRGLRGRSQLKHATILSDIEMVLNPTSGEEKTRPIGSKHVTITCDGPLTFDYENNVAIFEQNVHVKDASGDLYSDKLIAYLDGQSHTIRYAEAIGSVRIQQQGNTAYSDRAVYEPAIGKITLVGRPSLLIYPSEREAGMEFAISGLPSDTAASPRPDSP